MKLPLGNSKWAKVLIVLFVCAFLFTLSRCAHAGGRDPQIDFGLGSSVTHGAGAVMAEADYRFGIGFRGRDAPDAWVGTTLLGAQFGSQNNWAWHAGIEGHFGDWSVGLGFAYLARADTLNGEHANYTLTTAWHFHHFLWWRHDWEIRYRHFSDAGTSPINQGRDMLLVLVRLR